MADREASQAQATHARRGPQDGTADQLTKLADLHDHRVISDADYERGKDNVLHRSAA